MLFAEFADDVEHDEDVKRLWRRYAALEELLRGEEDSDRQIGHRREQVKLMLEAFPYWVKRQDAAASLAHRALTADGKP